MARSLERTSVAHVIQHPHLGSGVWHAGGAVAFGARLLPSSTSTIAKFRVVVAASASDDRLVTNPANATALNYGRNFVGISMGDRTLDAASQDATGFPVQVSGIARATLKANTACSKGDEAGYDPADDGTVQPITPSDRALLVPIGRFEQSKSSSADLQSVGVVLLTAQRGGFGPMSVAVADGTALTNSTTKPHSAACRSRPSTCSRQGRRSTFRRAWMSPAATGPTRLRSKRTLARRAHRRKPRRWM